MPKGTPTIKIRNVARLGAKVVLHGDDFDEAKAECARLAEAHGLHRVHSDGARKLHSVKTGCRAVAICLRAHEMAVAVGQRLVDNPLSSTGGKRSQRKRRKLSMERTR